MKTVETARTSQASLALGVTIRIPRVEHAADGDAKDETEGEKASASHRPTG